MPCILVVDDSVSLRLILAELLHDVGYEVRQASDGRQALDVIACGGLDLVLSDIHMPNLDGVALLQHVQAHGELLPWILMSSTLRGPAHFPVPFLAKPFEVDALLELIGRELVA